MNRFPLLIALSFAVPVSCQACATMTEDVETPIDITDESALIVWDAKTSTEHFVRRASFQTKAKDFGFLVPTPSQPQLGAVKDEIFTDLERELLPETKTVTRNTVNWRPFLFALLAGTGDASEDATATNAAASSEGMGEVEVVEERRVGDYNASILRASDTRSLTKWLHSHRYQVTSETREWLAPYIKAGYFITAFQIASDASSQYAQAEAVRLSFKSESPFYPYREPRHAQKTVGVGARTLRVFYVGEGRSQAHIAYDERRGQWPAATQYSAQLDSQKVRLEGVPLPEGPLRLTAFKDASSPRPGWGDLRFSPSSDQSELTPAPNIVYEDKQWWIPLDVLMVGLGLMIGYGPRLFKRNSI